MYNKFKINDIVRVKSKSPMSGKLYGAVGVIKELYVDMVFVDFKDRFYTISNKEAIALLHDGVYEQIISSNTGYYLYEKWLEKLESNTSNLNFKLQNGVLLEWY